MLQRFLMGLALCVAAVMPARAFTPESGFWYNPAEPGSGIAFEIQDDYVFLAAYVYDTQGRPTWFTAQGFMTGNDFYASTSNASDGSWLSSFINGQCIGCSYRAPTFQAGTGGTVTLDFLTERTANLTWGGRTFPIQRFDYFLTRTQGDNRTEMMLGEWQIVLDWYNRGGDSQLYPFEGDILIFDLVNRTPNPDRFEGCRPEDSRDGFCTNFALQQHEAAGFFDSGTGEHVIVVTDALATSQNLERLFAYYVITGTYQFDGVMEICNPGGCDQAGASFFPVRGFRSASRRFVEAGTGPNADPARASTKAAGTPRPGLIESRFPDGQLPVGMTAAEVKAQYGIDVEALRPKANELIRARGQRAPR